MNLDKFGDESVFEDESEDKLEALEEINPGSRHERRLFRRSTDLTHVTKPQYDTTGRDTYTKACDLLNVIPAQYFLSRITQPEIDLSHRGLGPTGIRAIVIAMLRNTCITKMNVKDNALGKEGAKCLNVMFEQNYFVDDLDVAQNSIGIKGAEYFANTLSYSNTLKKLDLSRNDVNDGGVRLLASALEKNSTLERLSLAHNNITELGAKHLRKALQENIRLNDLDLSWNQLRSKGAQEVSKALSSNVSLKVLNLSWNGLADKGAKFLWTALRKNSSIVKLILASNRIGDEGVKGILATLPYNDTLETLDITMNPVTKNMLCDILRRRQEVMSCSFNELIFRDKTMENDEQLRDLSRDLQTTNENFTLQLANVKVRDDHKVTEWQQKHNDELSERFLAFVRGRRIPLLDLFQKFGAGGDMVLSRTKFIQGMETIKQDVKMSDWEIRDLAQYFGNKEGQIHYSYLSSI